MRAVARSCEIKAEVVAADERESDRRRILNYGHTIGHALESLGGYRGLIHGEAVGIGLVAEAELAVHLGFCGKDVSARIRRLVQAAGLPDRLPPKTSFGALWRAMQHDKKVMGGTVIGVWPVRIGEVVIRPLAEESCAEWFGTREPVATSRKPGTRKT
jgi:3-dehydroquinate synthase